MFNFIPGILFLLPVLVIIGFTIAIYFGFRPPLNVEEGDPSDYGQSFETVSIPTRGGKKLFGWFIAAKSKNAKKAATLIVTHGWGGNAQYALEMMAPFLGTDVNILVFDVRSHGKSPSAFFTTLLVFEQDSHAATDWVKAEIYGDNLTHPPISLIGHSMGGAAVLLAASRRKDINSVISLSTFAHLDWLMHCFLKSFHVRESHIPFVLKIIEFLTGMNLDEVAPENTINKVPCPVLIMHGTDDEVLPFGQFERIRKACTNPRATFIVVEGATHYAIEPVQTHHMMVKKFLAGENETLPPLTGPTPPPSRLKTKPA